MKYLAGRKISREYSIRAPLSRSCTSFTKRPRSSYPPSNAWKLVWEMNEIHMQAGPFFVGTVCNTPRIVIVSKKLEMSPPCEQLKLNGFVNP